MPITACSKVYESGVLREVTGTAIRPGGLELTKRGLDYCRFAPGARLADVGCGAGATVEYLRGQRGFDASGVDQSRQLLEEGKLRDPYLPLAPGRAERLPYPDESLDGVLCECVLSLIPDPSVALREFGRVLEPGGRLIVSDLYLRSACDSVPHAPADSCRAPLPGPRSRGSVEELVRKAGFSLLLWEDHTALLRELAARLVLAGGSLEGFGCSAGATGGRPGYYLMIARKN